ncbi:MAG: DUF1189 domain-containing protein [Streptococcus sp.]|nr:DUF1189 domain-containing protein [Streptococcus sp.]
MFPYPLNYFASLFGSKRVFANRHLLTWFQLVFTSIFLISISLIPMSIQTISLSTYPLEILIDKVFEPIDKEVMEDFSNHVTIKDSQLVNKADTKIHHNTAGDVIIGHQDQAKLGKNLTLYFDKYELVISKEKKELAAINYRFLTEDSLTSKEQLTLDISTSWFQQNRFIISLFLILSSAILLGINFIFLSLGASLLLYFTKKSKLFSFKTFKECYNFILNCLGIPILAGLIIGLLGQPLPTVITTQNILFVLYLVIIFYKTHFRDADYGK